MGQQYSINLGLAALPETKPNESYMDILRLYGAVKALAVALDAYTGVLPQDEALWPLLTPADTIHSQNQHRLYVLFTENVTPGQVVTLVDASGVLTAKLAGGSAHAGAARGFSTGTVVSGNYGEVILFGLCRYISGMTPGTLYYISAVTAGSITAVSPGTPYHQAVGYALSAKSLFFNPSLEML